MVQQTKTLNELENLSEKELEGIILGKEKNMDDARYVLGKLMVEGTSAGVPQNENKGLNWLKEAAKNGHMDALEYKTYWDIRFDRSPKLQKIQESLEKIIAHNKSSRACNTLAELNHATAGNNINSDNAELKEGAEKARDKAAKYYMMSAEQQDIIGIHWMGVFYHEGFGVAKNIEKAIQYLSRSAATGNGQSHYQLYLIHSGKDEQDLTYKNVEAAYTYLLNALIRGVTFFDEMVAFFRQNYAELAPLYLKNQNLQIEVNEENEKNILNMHEAWVGELKVGFSTALGKDRLYHRPCGFLNDQQIWMVGVQLEYFTSTVLRYDHTDFLKAVRMDLGPILGDIGLWALKCQQDMAKNRVDKEDKKKLQVAYDLVEKYLDSGLDVLKQEKKYNF